MLYEIQREIAADLTTRGVPFPCNYGPDKAGAAALTRSRIVIDVDDELGDEFAAAMKAGRNPTMRAVLWQGAFCRIFVRSDEGAARVHEHRRLAMQAVRMVYVALEKSVAARHNRFRIASAKFLNATELQLRGIENWPGVVYELRFAVDSAVNDTNWVGDAKPEVTIDPDTGAVIASTTQALQRGAPEGTDPVTACGEA